MYSGFRKLTTLGALCSLLALTGVATAQPSSADKESARALMQRGDTAFEQRDFDAALSAYRGAHSLMRVPTTGVAVARAHAALGQLVEARDAALAVGRLPAAPDEPEPFVAARSEAKDLAREIAGRIPTLRVRVAGLGEGASYELTMDGAVVPAEARELPRRLNPGKHVVVVRAAGFQEATQTVTLAERDAQNIELRLTAVPEGSIVEPVPVPASEAAPGGATSPLVYIGFGVGGAGLVAGSIAGVLSLSSASSAKEHCDGNACAAAARDDIDRSKTYALVSNIGFGVAIAGTAVGIYGLLSSGEAQQERPASRVEPVVGFGYLGVRGSL